MKLTRIFVPIVASLVLYSCASNNLSYEGKAFKTAYESIKADELKEKPHGHCFQTRWKADKPALKVKKKQAFT